VLARQRQCAFQRLGGGAPVAVQHAGQAKPLVRVDAGKGASHTLGEIDRFQGVPARLWASGLAALSPDQSLISAVTLRPLISTSPGSRDRARRGAHR
jgi:hypothetical protein